MDHLIVGIHQPNYLPWLGYFFKIFISDIFIILDDVEYSSASLSKRCFVRKQKFAMDKSYLSIPLQKHSNHCLIQNLYIDHKQAWQQKQLNQVFAVYKSAKYFEAYFPFLEMLLEQTKKYEKLADFNEFVMLKILNLLGLQKKIIKSSKLPVSGHKADYVINLVEYYKASHYFSGTGARKYQKEENFHTRNIKLVYNEIFSFLAEKKYPQAQGDFLNGLSIIDVLFNIGAKEIVLLFEKYKSNLDFS